MSVSKVKVLDGCILCAVCEQACPEVFTMGDSAALVKDGIDLNKFESAIREAASSCPVSVIEVND